MTKTPKSEIDALRARIRENEEMMDRYRNPVRSKLLEALDNKGRVKMGEVVDYIAEKVLEKVEASLEDKKQDSIPEEPDKAVCKSWWIIKAEKGVHKTAYSCYQNGGYNQTRLIEPPPAGIVWEAILSNACNRGGALGADRVIVVLKELGMIKKEE